MLVVLNPGGNAAIAWLVRTIKAGELGQEIVRHYNNPSTEYTTVLYGTVL